MVIVYLNLTLLIIQLGAKKYSCEQIQQMFQFYLDNYSNKNKLDMLNKKFNINFKRSALNGLFNKHGYKIKEHLSC